MPNLDVFLTETAKTRQEEIIEVCKNIAIYNKATLDTLKESTRNSFNNVWRNPEATPQEIFASFGTNAVKLFVVAGATIQFIKALDPEWEEPVPPYQYSINPDGTVTVGNIIE